MKIHYFQRYHGKENVATANTMLLLSRLYSYSTDKFFRFLKSEYFSDSFEPELVFSMQEKSIDSIPDATITQVGFKIVVETKLTDWFYSEQIMRHLKSFGDEKHKVIITLASEFMAEEKKEEIDKKIEAYNQEQENSIIHINSTFEYLANAIQDLIDDRDYAMQEILDDYLDYCYNAGLIPLSDAWKYLRVQLAAATMDYNVEHNIYFDNAERGFRPHEYLGLYKNKSVRAVGKLCARITAIEIDGEMQFKAEQGEITEERKQKIMDAIKYAHGRGNDLMVKEHRYFFVENFCHMDFKKNTPKAPMGTRIFDLEQLLGTEQIPDIETIATKLSTMSWS